MSDFLMRPLIIGGSGQLGTGFRKALKCRPQTVAPSHDEVDIEVPETIQAALLQYEPTAVINCAAYHDVEGCERDPARAFWMNATAVDMLADLCAKAAVPLVHISTDFVFNGAFTCPDESDTPCPINAYGISKLAGEHALRRRSAETYCFRTSGLFSDATTSSKGPPFLKRVFDRVRLGESIDIVDDLYFSPGHVDLIAERIVRALWLEDCPSIVHVTGGAWCTWHAFAKRAVEIAGLDIDLVRPVPYTGKTLRPKYSMIHNKALQDRALYGPHWEYGLRDVVEALMVA